MHKARACGLPIADPHVLSAAAERKPDAPVRFPGFDPVRDTFRSVLKEDLAHYTVTVPCGNGEWQDPPAGCGRETVETEGQVSRSALFTL